jgi:hypothetical protein
MPFNLVVRRADPQVKPLHSEGRNSRNRDKVESTEDCMIGFGVFLQVGEEILRY